MVQRAILTPTNDDVQKLSDMFIDQFPREEHDLLLFDGVEGDNHNLYQQEFLKSIAQGSLPPHILKIKKGNMLDVEILTGSNAGKRAFLSRIKIKTSASDGLHFVLSRKQFPVRLSFAITINKSQGQTIPNVGIYLPRYVFSHGQLYVALSRGVSHTTTRVLTREGKLKGEDGDYTKNVVYKQILLSHPQITDFEDKWNTWKDEQSISSIGKLDNKFFKSQERIDKGMYEELIRIFIR
ncbi:ATP-dependent DNA helicase PIF1-like [Lathyrus oleraceus]|uniref:ATP-dependent DNA helicase PIF1-like n=1 Tax=Pisum sativum TaxID=3888 RepID=UPI0021D04FDA|nr:ATP-dependent DNA helicase PIF1-like [Pisum sativum]